MADVQGFPGDKHVTPVTEMVGAVYLVQGGKVVFYVSVHELCIEVGSAHHSPLETFGWTFNCSRFTWEINVVFN